MRVLYLTEKQTESLENDGNIIIEVDNIAMNLSKGGELTIKEHIAIFGTNGKIHESNKGGY